MAGTWVSLFSGGKDSSWALHQAIETGRSVRRLLTVHPPRESYLYHVPATKLARLAAESIDISLVEVDTDIDVTESTDSSVQGDRELRPLESTLTSLTSDLSVTGLIAGAVESEFQATRLRAMCGRLDIELYTPLWQEDPFELAHEMVEAGFEIVIVSVAAEGLDRSWLGRTLDTAAIEELSRLHEVSGVHLLGEGGEYETLVTDGPHMDRPLEIEAEPTWHGNRGELHITDAWLE